MTQQKQLNPKQASIKRLKKLVLMDIQTVRVMKAAKGFPFLCPVCKRVDTTQDYLRFYETDNPNPICVHVDCLLVKMDWKHSEEQ